MKDTTNILIAAVGGQGALLASKILGAFATARGDDVKMSEIHGMAQRGGSVVTHVRFGEKVFSPTIEQGSADVLLAFEMLEAARHAAMLKPGGTVIVNTQAIAPLPVLTNEMPYPADIIGNLKKMNLRVWHTDALDLARRAGHVKTVNTVLIGMYARMTGDPAESWLKVLAENLPPKLYKVNQAAFTAGYNLSPPWTEQE